MTLKKWLSLIAGATLFLTVFVGFINYIIDPLQLYRKATWYRTCFCIDPRYLNPGLAKNFDYDSVIIGTSMSENFVPSYIEKKLDMKALKLTLPGATAYEESRIMQAAIDTGKVKNVIYGLDLFSFSGDPGKTMHIEKRFPSHIYDNSYLNDHKYLFNLDTLIYQSGRVLAANILKTENKLDIDMAYNWNSSHTFSKARAMRDWSVRRSAALKDAEKYRFADLKANFDQHVLPHIKNNPAIRFYIFYPPYSILSWEDISERGFLEDALRFHRYVFEATQGLANVRVYDMQDEEKITFDLDNYRDVNHHSQRINELIIDAIARGAYLMTDKNADEHIRRLRKQVDEFEPGA